MRGAVLISGFGCPCDLYRRLYAMPVVEWWKDARPSIREFAKKVRGADTVITHSAGGLLLAYAIRFGLLSAKNMNVVAVDCHFPRFHPAGRDGYLELLLERTRRSCKSRRVKRMHTQASQRYRTTLLRWLTYINDLGRRWQQSTRLGPPVEVKSWLQIQCTRTSYHPFTGPSYGNNPFLQQIIRLFGAHITVIPRATHYDLIIHDSAAFHCIHTHLNRQKRS